MITVKDLLDKKGHTYHFISPEATIFDALKLMAEKNVGAIMVIHNGKLVGMFSERDYARKIILQGYSSKEAKVGDFMSTDLVIARPEMTIYECMAIMLQKKVRHLPVLDHNEISGIITIRDVVKAVVHEQNVVIKDLENYIMGGGYGANP